MLDVFVWVGAGESSVYNCSTKDHLLKISELIIRQVDNFNLEKEIEKFRKRVEQTDNHDTLKKIIMGFLRSNDLLGDDIFEYGTMFTTIEEL
jgi:hypothetical protein